MPSPWVCSSIKWITLVMPTRGRSNVENMIRTYVFYKVGMLHLKYVIRGWLGDLYGTSVHHRWSTLAVSGQSTNAIFENVLICRAHDTIGKFLCRVYTTLVCLPKKFTHVEHATKDDTWNAGSYTTRHTNTQLGLLSNVGSHRDHERVRSAQVLSRPHSAGRLDYVKHAILRVCGTRTPWK